MPLCNGDVGEIGGGLSRQVAQVETPKSKGEPPTVTCTMFKNVECTVAGESTIPAECILHFLHANGIVGLR